jgi:hypothetical protein
MVWIVCAMLATALRRARRFRQPPTRMWPASGRESTRHLTGGTATSILRSSKR